MGQYSTAIIRGADGTTAVSVIKRNSKLTLKQKIGKFKYKLKRAYVERTIKANSLPEMTPKRGASQTSLRSRVNEEFTKGTRSKLMDTG